MCVVQESFTFGWKQTVRTDEALGAITSVLERTRVCPLSCLMELLLCTLISLIKINSKLYLNNMFYSFCSKTYNELSSKLVSCSTGLRKIYIDYCISVLQASNLCFVENASFFSLTRKYLGYITFTQVQFQMSLVIDF